MRIDKKDLLSRMVEDVMIEYLKNNKEI